MQAMGGVLWQFRVAIVMALASCTAAALLILLSYFVAPLQADIKDQYIGTTTLDAAGQATIILPPFIEAEHSSFTYIVGGLDTPMPGLFVKSQLHDNQFTASGGTPGGTLMWEVVGHRAAR